MACFAIAYPVVLRVKPGNQGLVQYLHLVFCLGRISRAQLLAGNAGLSHFHAGVAGINADVIYGVVSAFGVIAIVVYYHQELMEILHARSVLQRALQIHLIPFARIFITKPKRGKITSGERVYQFSVRYLATGVFSNTIELE